MTNDEYIVDFNRAVVAAWMDCMKEVALATQEEEVQDQIFVPQVAWPEGTEYLSNGPFFD
jgi:hypothetical protein